jgi:predicted nucleotidyltransferase
VTARLFDLDSARRAELARLLAIALADEPEVVFAYLYGSFVGDRPFHDIDVGVYLSNAPADQTRQAVALADRLSRRLELPVDVRALNAAPVPFVFHALQGELLVSHDDQKLADVLERIGRRYIDLAPVLRRATRDAFAS